MFRTVSPLLAVAAFSCISFAGAAHAGGKDRPDPFVAQAIRDTAVPEPAPEIPTVKETYAVSAPLAAEPVPVPEDVPVARPPGRRWGNMILQPSLVLQQDYDSNITASDGNTNRREADFVTHLVPRLHIGLAESRHEMNFEAEYETRRYWANHSEDHDNYKIGVKGNLAASPSFRVPYEFAWRRPHEERIDDLTAQNSVKPLEQRDFKAAMGLEYKPKSYGLALHGSYHSKNFENGVDGTGAAIMRSDADHDATEAEARFLFDFNPRNMLTFAVSAGKRDYNTLNFQAGGFTGPSRNGSTYGASADWRLRFKGLSTDMKFGLGARDFDDAAIGDVRALVGDARISYDYSDKTVIDLTLARDIHEDDEVIEPIVRTKAGLFVDHALRESILLGAGLDYATWSFQDSARDDDYWTYRFLVDWLIGERVSLGAEYNRTTRDSEAPGLDMTRDLILVSLRGRL